MNKAAIFCISVLAVLSSSVFQLSGQSKGKELGLKTVVIDAGHGGKDPGALGKTRKTDEKHIALSVSLLFGEKIKAEYPDVKVVYTRSTDVFLELKQRAAVAKKADADLFLSIHCNSVPNSRAFGAAAYILGPKSNNPKNTSDYFEKGQSVAQRENSVMLLEDDYQTSYQGFNPNSPESVIGSNLLWMANYENSLLFAAEYDAYIHKAPYRESNYTGIHQDVFYLLWATGMPSALLEIGFLSNPQDYAVMSTAEGQEKIATTIFNAFRNYKKKYDASVGAYSEEKPSKPSKPEQVSAAETRKPSVEKKPADVSSDVYYGIQIMGLGRVLKSDDPALKGLKCRTVKADDSNIYKYITGTASTKEGAVSGLAAVRKKFPEAFLVKVTGNKVERIR